VLETQDIWCNLQDDDMNAFIVHVKDVFLGSCACPLVLLYRGFRRAKKHLEHIGISLMLAGPWAFLGSLIAPPTRNACLRLLTSTDCVHLSSTPYSWHSRPRMHAKSIAH